MTGTYIVGPSCIEVTDLSCLEVCPVDCIYQIGEASSDPTLPLMVVIDPVECISCGACEPECPVEAISIDSMTPPAWESFIEINAMHEGRGANDGPAPERRTNHPDIVEAVTANLANAED